MLDSPGLDPALFSQPGMRAALTSRDISQVYCLLNGAAIPQRMIAQVARTRV